MAISEHTDLEIRAGDYDRLWWPTGTLEAFASGLVGQYVRITGGTNFTKGFYLVTGYGESGGDYYSDLKRACATGNSTDGTAETGADPFTNVYDLLWLTLNNETAFTSIVTSRTQINLSDDDPDPYRDHHATYDYPEAILEPAGMEANLWSDSTGSQVLLRFTLRLAAGDKRVDKVLYPLRWAVVKALHPLQDGDSSGLDYIWSLRLVTGEDDVDHESNEGWVDVLGIEVGLHFTDTQVAVLV